MYNYLQVIHLYKKNKCITRNKISKQLYANKNLKTSANIDIILLIKHLNEH